MNPSSAPARPSAPPPPRPDRTARLPAPASTTPAVAGTVLRLCSVFEPPPEALLRRRRRGVRPDRRHAEPHRRADPRPGPARRAPARPDLPARRAAVAHVRSARPATGRAHGRAGPLGPGSCGPPTPLRELAAAAGRRAGARPPGRGRRGAAAGRAGRPPRRRAARRHACTAASRARVDRSRRRPLTVLGPPVERRVAAARRRGARAHRARGPGGRRGRRRPRPRPRRAVGLLAGAVRRAARRPDAARAAPAGAVRRAARRPEAAAGRGRRARADARRRPPRGGRRRPAAPRRSRRRWPPRRRATGCTCSGSRRTSRCPPTWRTPTSSSCRRSTRSSAACSSRRWPAGCRSSPTGSAASRRSCATASPAASSSAATSPALAAALADGAHRPAHHPAHDRGRAGARRPRLLLAGARRARARRLRGRPAPVTPRSGGVAVLVPGPRPGGLPAARARQPAGAGLHRRSSASSSTTARATPRRCRTTRGCGSSGCRTTAVWAPRSTARLDATTAPVVAYLPADDAWDADHLSALLAALDGADLAASGVPVAGRRDARGAARTAGLQLVQVAHRRTGARWPERDELEADDLELLMWRHFPARAATGELTCTWTDHPGQRSRAIRESTRRRAERLPAPVPRARRRCGCTRATAG